MKQKVINIGARQIGGDNKCFIIAEMGSNHDGDFARAKDLIDIACEAGCDAVKIQVVYAEECYPPGTRYPAHYGDEDLADIIKRKEIPKQWVSDLRRYAHNCGILFGASTDGFIGLDTMINNGVDFVKIPSFALSNIPLLIRASKSKLPIILGTGVHSLGQVEEALMVIDTVDLAMLHCVSAYPASLDGLNLANMKFYDEAFPVPIGFSDHSVDPKIAPGFAVALGAKLLEKHYTYDKKMPGPDHYFAIEPQELRVMVEEVRKIESDSEYRDSLIQNQDNSQIYGKIRTGIYDQENDIHKRTRLGIYFLNDLDMGSILKPSDVRVFRCGNTEPKLHPRYLDVVVGATLVTDASKYESVSWEHIIEKR